MLNHVTGLARGVGERTNDAWNLGELPESTQTLQSLGETRDFTRQGGAFLGSLLAKAPATSKWDLAHRFRQDEVLKRCQLKQVIGPSQVQLSAFGAV